MKFFRWLSQFYIFNRAVKSQKRSGLCCSDCNAQTHRHDRYVILTPRHRDCRDPKMVGQKSL